MTSGQKKRLGFVGVLIVIALVVIAPTFIKDSLPDAWPAEEIKLGLDLRGGVYLVMGVHTAEAVKSRLAAIAGDIKNELRQQGIIKAKQVREREIEIHLLGERGMPKLTEFVQSTYRELVHLDTKKEEGKVKVIYRIKEEDAQQIEKTSVEQAIETIRNRVDQFGVAEPLIQRSHEKRILVQLPAVTENIEVVKKTIGSVAKLEFRLVAEPNAPRGETVRRRNREGSDLVLEDEVVMTGDSIARAFVDINPSTNEAEVSLQLNSTGARIFERVTAANVQRRLAIILDNIVQSAPVIRDRIAGGRASISGGFSPQEARLLAIVLRAGALPAPLEFLEERTVGATLGEDSIRQGVLALVVGSVLVLIFTVFYYRRSGMLAVGCLFLNLVFLMGLLALLGATLTLPGIAGVVLTVGMAVDANVIIFERIREEIRAGGTPKASVDAGFLKAHWTILDANITTLLTGLVLYGFGSGPIKGFAVTLCLGIVTSVFTALFVAKLGFEILKLRTADEKLSI